MSNAKPVDVFGKYMFKVHVDGNDFLWRWSPMTGLWVMEDVVGLQVSTCREWLHDLNEGGGIEVSNTPTGLMRRIPDEVCTEFTPYAGPCPTDEFEYEKHVAWNVPKHDWFSKRTVDYMKSEICGLRACDWDAVLESIRLRKDILIHGYTGCLVEMLSRYYGGVVNVSGTTAKSIRTATTSMITPVACILGKHSPEDVKKMPRGYARSLVVVVRDEFKDHPDVIRITKEVKFRECEMSDFVYAVNRERVLETAFQMTKYIETPNSLGTSCITDGIFLFTNEACLIKWLHSRMGGGAYTREFPPIKISLASLIRNIEYLYPGLDREIKIRMEKLHNAVYLNGVHGFDHPDAPKWMCYYKTDDYEVVGGQRFDTLRWKHNPRA